MTDQSVTEANQRKSDRRLPWQRLAIALIIIVAIAIILPILLVAFPGHTSYVEIKP